jgi:hypothetical protein
MNRWQRLKEKKKIHAAVFSSLQATGDDYLIRTASVPNTSLTRLGTPGSSTTTRPSTSRFKRIRKKSVTVAKKKH